MSAKDDKAKVETATSAEAEVAVEAPVTVEVEAAIEVEVVAAAPAPPAREEHVPDVFVARVNWLPHDYA